MTEKNKSSWIPKIKNIEDANETLNKNGIVGYFVFGMYALGLVFLLFTNKNVAIGQEILAEDMIYNAIGMIIIMLVCLFWAWRMHKKDGLVSATLLLCLFCYEIYAKVLAGTTNPGWFFVYIIMLLGFINSIRAIRFIKMHKRLETSPLETANG
jgi:hypothetical protein